MSSDQARQGGGTPPVPQAREPGRRGRHGRHRRRRGRQGRRGRSARAGGQGLPRDRPRQAGLRARPLLSGRQATVVSSQGRASMLRKKTNGTAGGSRISQTLAGLTGGVLDRRTFLNRSGLAAGGIAAASLAGGGMVTRAKAQTQAAAGAVQQIKSVCTHCSVGCTVIAEVENGVWTGQEPGFDSPFNLGSHCAKGASVREHGHGERRLKYPMKLVGGKYERISWEQAINEVGDKLLAIREADGPDAGLWIGGSKHSNEGAYLYPQVRRVLGHQQLRQPGPDLPFDHGRGRGQHLGLRRDDQQLQRHAQFARDAVHRLQCGRGASGRDDAHPQGQGAEQRRADRLRPALHANRGACRRVRALPLGHRRRADLGHPLAHLRERLGGQGVHPPARLGHGPGPARGREVDARGGRARHRRARLAAQAGRRRPWPTTAPARWSGAWAAPSITAATTTPAPTASCSWRSATSASPAAGPTSSAATTTSRVRPTSATCRTACRATTA